MQIHARTCARVIATKRAEELPGVDPGGILGPVKKPLIIVESPTKARTIKKFLAGAICGESIRGARSRPSEEHARRRRRARFYAEIPDDQGQGRYHQRAARRGKSATDVYLATDPDREGEAIAWHLAELLKLPNPQRIELHEITKEAALGGAQRPAPHRHGSRQRAAGAAYSRPARRL